MKSSREHGKLSYVILTFLSRLLLRCGAHRPVIRKFSLCYFVPFYVLLMTYLDYFVPLSQKCKIVTNSRPIYFFCTISVLFVEYLLTLLDYFTSH
ncbi:hypothetical protein EDC04DRAFT_260669 [Pisolithus marmoratus]|nr:hypothetical protein EDC04DRAFT_260669 [Pisolithus marmoratus]